MSTHEDITLVLGIPIDNLTLESAVQRTLELADAYRRDGRPRQIATVNVDFLTNALSWTPGGAPRHPELLDILRRADLVTADGMPVVWLAKLLGTPLHGRVTGADLAPALASAMAVSGHSLYFLGGQGDIGQQAAQRLQDLNPGLRIADVHSPFVHTEGEASLAADADDQAIVERINRAEPDVLLIGFGNPKQELWFHRNRHRLKAGVSIGVGGTFEFIVGRVSRAPKWMQKTGLEWLFRISQDPKRLWKRYAVGLMKLAVMSLPLVISYRLRKRLHAPRPPSQSAPTPRGSEQTLRLPAQADAAWVRSQSEFSLDGASARQTLVVDFSQLRFIDSSALGYLTRLWKNAQNQNIATQALGLSLTPAAGLLKMTRTWDMFAENGSVNFSQTSAASQQLADGFVDIDSKPGGPCIARLHGRLDADQAERLAIDELTEALGAGDCILDLSDLSFVDSTGLRLFFQLQRHFSGQERELALCGAQPAVRQLMLVTRLNKLFQLLPDQQAAQAYLANRQPRATQDGADQTVPGSALDHLIRAAYWIAYRAEMALNVLRRPRTQGAYVALWRNGAVLLIRNSYKTPYTLPCGKVKANEQPLDAARRELREEVGLALPPEALRKTFETLNRSEFKEDRIHVFEARLDTQPKLLLDGREVTWAGFRSPSAALAMPLFAPVREYLLQAISHGQGD